MLRPRVDLAASAARRPTADGAYSGVLEAPGPACEAWLRSPAFEERLFANFPCADPPLDVRPPRALLLVHPNPMALTRSSA
jgi:hypothetical protein